MDPVAPPAGLSASFAAGSVVLNWAASPDTVLGYHVYRADASVGLFSRLTSSLVSGTTFTDMTASSNIYTYMVRAVKLMTTPSGTYFSASQGVFVSANAANSTLLIATRAIQSAHSLLLSWNSQSQMVYRVLAKTNLNEPNWTDVSGNITATGTSASWTDTNINVNPRRFYRIVSP